METRRRQEEREELSLRQNFLSSSPQRGGYLCFRVETKLLSLSVSERNLLKGAIACDHWSIELVLLFIVSVL